MLVFLLLFSPRRSTRARPCRTASLEADRDDDLTTVPGMDRRALARTVNIDGTASKVVRFPAVDENMVAKCFAGQILDHRSLQSGVDTRWTWPNRDRTFCNRPFALCVVISAAPRRLR